MPTTPPQDVACRELGIPGISDAQPIGSGGFSRVYAATDARLMRRVAVKVLDDYLSEAAKRRFARECEVMGRLSRHPNVVTVHSAGVTDDQRPYLVMELLDGGSLADRLRERGPLPWAEALRYTIPVAQALDAAHRAGVLHRDIKPANILLADDVPHLGDFGISRITDGEIDTSGEVVASWLHSPPETVDDLRDERSDIYSLASTLYTLLAGHPPFGDRKRTSFAAAVRRMAADGPPELPPETCPPAFNEFFASALARNPDDRPQTAADLVEALLALRRPDDGSHDGRLARWWGVLGWAAAAAAVAGFAAVMALTVLAGVGGDGVPDAGEGAEGQRANPAVDRGDQGDPYPLGQSVDVFYDDFSVGAERRWRVAVVDEIEDGVVVGYDVTRSGYRAAVTSVRLTYDEGPEPGWIGQLRFSAVDGSGDVYAPSDGACGSFGDQLDLDGELSPAESVEGELCFLVPADALSSLVLRVEAEPVDGAAHLRMR